MKEKNRYLKILSYLSNNDAIEEFLDITRFLDSYCNEPDQQYFIVNKKNPRTRKIVKFLETIREDGFIKYKDRSQYATNYEAETEWSTPIKFEASITIKGIEFYNSHLLRRKTINNMYWTKFLSIIAILISFCSILIAYNVYIHNNEVKKLNLNSTELLKK